MEPKKVLLSVAAVGILSAAGIGAYEAGREVAVKDLFPGYVEPPARVQPPVRDGGATGHLIQLGDQLCDLGLLQAGASRDEACSVEQP